MFSILFGPDSAEAPELVTHRPESFADLHLDQIVDSVTAGFDEYKLHEFFYTPLTTTAALEYRHQVLDDLAKPDVLRAVRDFAESMRRARAELHESESRRYALQKQAWFLNAVGSYCDAVKDLSRSLTTLPVRSAGFVALQSYLRAYRDSEAFGTLDAEADELVRKLARVEYSVHIDGSRVRVGPFDGEPNYSDDVRDTFAKFKQGDVASHLIRFSNDADMNHVEAQILGLVAKLNPDTFSALRTFGVDHNAFTDGVLARFDREIQFYIGFLDYLRPLQATKLHMCTPLVTPHADRVHATDTFDLALARKKTADAVDIVTNSFELTSPERVLVVSGPNQGGKTTFARTFGQLHYLACLGLPVPGTSAELALFDHLYTHFEREEQLADLHGRLEGELVRIQKILATTGPDTIVVVNEIFTSTTLADALTLGRKILAQLIDKSALCVYVTFIDELSRLGPATVSIVSQVAPDDPAQRTFKLVRRPADGLAYAAAIANKYGLSYDRVKERLSS